MGFKVLGLIFLSVYSQAQEVEFLTKEQARLFIQESHRNPSLLVRSSAGGAVVEIEQKPKPRTPPTIDTEPDRVEDGKNKHWQFMFGLGFNVGSNFVTGAVAEQGRLNDSDFGQYGFKLGFEAMIRPPHTKFSRMAFGAAHSLNNNLIGDKPFYYSASGPTWQGEKDGLVPRGVGSTRQTLYFGEYDVYMTPDDDPKTAFSLGYWIGKTRTDNDDPNDPRNDMLYRDHGPQIRIRGLWGAGLTPYALIRISNKRQHSIVFGLSVERFKRNKAPPDKTK